MPGETRRYTFDNKPIYLYGEKGTSVGNPKNVQDFYKIRQQCLDSGTLFEDPEFPAIDKSLYYKERPNRSFKWLRPKEFCKFQRPKFFVGGFSRFDIIQGELGDCWFIAAVANLTQDPKIFGRVVCDDNSFDENYAGIFHFCFWQYGKWVDVVIDDRLPTYDGHLMYMHSKDSNEFWSALLEKAYAKLNGSYEALRSGNAIDALEDFTGGITETFDLKNPPKKLFHILAKGFERNSTMSCSISSHSNAIEGHTPEGLVTGHAYSITKVALVQNTVPGVKAETALIRIRNPWGNHNEWNGPWSDKSKEWKNITEESRQKIGLTFDNDGEFWMDFPSFHKYFTSMEICNLGPDSISKVSGVKKMKDWAYDEFEGSWIKGISAGGNISNVSSFTRNPQYVITLRDVDDDDDDGKCTVVIALMQKNRRARKAFGEKSLPIGFMVYPLKPKDLEQKPQTAEFFKYTQPVTNKINFTDAREISARFALAPGSYLIIPSTYDENQEGDFLVRVFSESGHTFEENDVDVGTGDIDERIIEDPKVPSPAKSAFEQMFDTIAGPEKEIGWVQMKQIIDASFKDECPGGFSKDISRAMVAMLDFDRSGKLRFTEFEMLIHDMLRWNLAFKLFDTDNTKQLNAFELRDALASAGYRLNNNILNTLLYRFGTPEKNIVFDDFIMCAVKVKSMMETYNEKDINHDNRAIFSMEEWMMKALYS